MSLLRTTPAGKAPQVDELLAAVGEIAFIAGGAARQLVLPMEAPPAGDIDVFLYEPDSYDACKRSISGLGYSFCGDTEHSACFDPRSDADLPVQVIKPDQDPLACTAGSVESVLSHFSFTTEQFAVIHDGTALIGASAISDTRERVLTIVNINDPLAVAARATKYAAKAYYAPMWELHRLFLEWDKRTSEWKRQVAIVQSANQANAN